MSSEEDEAEGEDDSPVRAHAVALADRAAPQTEARAVVIAITARSTA